MEETYKTDCLNYKILILLKDVKNKFKVSLNVINEYYK